MKEASFDSLTAYLTACRGWECPDLLVVGHAAPDGDAVVSAVAEAFRRYLTDGTRAVPVVQASALPRETAYLLGQVAPLVPTEEWLSRHPAVPLVLTDHFEEPFLPHRVVAVVDHHQPGDTADFTDVDVTIRRVGAATTLVAAAMRRESILPDPFMARLLLGAILLDTDCMTPSKTYPEDRDAVLWLSLLCGEDTAALYDTLRDILLSETDPAVLYGRDYRLYADRRGDPLLGFAILKVWDTALPDTAAVRRLLQEDRRQRLCSVCVAKISAYSREGLQAERYLVDGENGAAAAMIAVIAEMGGEQVEQVADDEVYLPKDAVHRGRKWLANQLLAALNKEK